MLYWEMKCRAKGVQKNVIVCISVCVWAYALACGKRKSYSMFMFVFFFSIPEWMQMEAEHIMKLGCHTLSSFAQWKDLLKSV